MPRLPSRALTPADARIIKRLLKAGWLQSDIASFMGVNGGRISEISTGQHFASEAPCDLSDPYWRSRFSRLQTDWMARMTSLLKSLDQP